MSKYRIMYNGHNYRIQRKIGWFKWEWVVEPDIFRPGPAQFTNRDDAEKYIDNLKVIEAPYKEVSNKRETTLWGLLLDKDDGNE